MNDATQEEALSVVRELNFQPRLCLRLWNFVRNAMPFDARYLEASKYFIAD